MNDEPITQVRYLTDDRDTEDRHELVITLGGNGDWYVAVVPEGHGAVRGVRICTSGGAAHAAPGLGVAIAQAYMALLQAAKPEPLPTRFIIDDLDGFLASDEVEPLQVESHILRACPDGHRWVPNPDYELAPYELGPDGTYRLRPGFKP